MTFYIFATKNVLFVFKKCTFRFCDYNYKDSILYDASTNKPVAKLSVKMQDTLSEWKEKGYEVKSASVRFVVAWKPKDAPKDEQETAVLLADMVLSKFLK